MLEVEEREKKRLIGGFMAMRLAVLPMPVVLMIWLIGWDHTWWRRGIMIGCMATMMTVVGRETLRFRRLPRRGE